MCCAAWCPDMDMVCCDDSVTVKTSWKLNTMSCCHAPWFEIWWEARHVNTWYDMPQYDMSGILVCSRQWAGSSKNKNFKYLQVSFGGMCLYIPTAECHRLGFSASHALHIVTPSEITELQKKHGTHRLDPFGNLDICWIQNLKKQGCQVSVCPCTPFSQLHLWDIHMPCEEKGRCSSPGSQKMPSTAKSCHASELATSSPSLCVSLHLCICISKYFKLNFIFSYPVLTSEASSFYICHSFRWNTWYLCIYNILYNIYIHISECPFTCHLPTYLPTYSCFLSIYLNSPQSTYLSICQSTWRTGLTLYISVDLPK